MRAVATAVVSAVLLAAVTAAVTAGDRGVSARAFMDVYRVLQHPRCLNCHPAGDGPLHGDDSHPHSFGVKRGPDGKGLPVARCANCHQDSNQPGEHQPPGAPQPREARQPQGTPLWQLPSPRMPLVFQGRTPAQLCRQLLNPKANAGMTPAALIEHVEHHPLVLWGWRPGEGRTTPPISHARFVDAVKAWIETGPVCPAE